MVSNIQVGQSIQAAYLFRCEICPPPVQLGRIWIANGKYQVDIKVNLCSRRVIMVYESDLEDDMRQLGDTSVSGRGQVNRRVECSCSKGQRVISGWIIGDDEQIEWLVVVKVLVCKGLLSIRWDCRVDRGNWIGGGIQ